MIATATGLVVETTDTLGWNGDALEAEGFAYMAVRTLRRLPISFPRTTGVPAAMTGGVVDRV
jgi:anhydro-N-acetylmuramic acid kinase